MECPRGTRPFIGKSYIILSICYIHRNSTGKSYEFYIKTMKSIGFTYGVPKYITERQNCIGFTYENPITNLYLFTVLDLEDWCSMLSQNWMNFKKASAAIKNNGVLVEFHSFFQFWLNIRAPNLKIQIKWIMVSLLTPLRSLEASK